jgi:sirohydrochlorin ferrochelatase
LTNKAPAGEPLREALLILVEGPAADTTENVLALELTRWARRKGTFAEVEIAGLEGNPTLEEQMARIASENVRIYPLIMTDRMSVESAISARLSITAGMDAFGHAIRIEDPLGADPNLANVLVANLKDAAACAAIPAGKSILLIWPAGGGQTHSQLATRQLADRIIRSGEFQEVRVLAGGYAAEREDCGLKAGQSALLLLFSTATPEHVQRSIERSLGGNIHVVRQLGGYAPILELAALHLSI